MAFGPRNHGCAFEAHRAHFLAGSARCAYRALRRRVPTNFFQAKISLFQPLGSVQQEIGFRLL
jgi:hypothetical protein